MISKWNYLPLTSNEQQIAQTLGDRYPKVPALCKLLAQRGVTSAAEAEKFFKPQLSDLHDPFLMRDMEKAVVRLNRALGSKEKIMIYGDYDVDGTTAVSLVYKFLQNYYSGLDYYIPDRYEEGYGISDKSIDYAAENGITLFIALDCGIKAVEKIAYAKSKGIDFIICDHHMPDDQLPDAVAILNPKLEGETYPYKHLSGWRRLQIHARVCHQQRYRHNFRPRTAARSRRREHSVRHRTHNRGKPNPRLSRS